MTRPLLPLLLTAASLLAGCATAPAPLGAPPREHDLSRVRATAEAPAGYSVAAPQSVWETSIAVSPANPSNAVVAGMHRANSRSPYVVRTFWTEDGGATWNPSAPPSLATTRWQYDKQGDPVVVFDRSGAAYLVSLIAWGAYDRSGIALWRSTDGGRTWSEPRPIVEREKEHFDDKEWVAVDTTGGPRDGTIYVAWLRADSNIDYSVIELVFTRSTDGGLTWSPEKVIGRGGGPQFAIGPDGEVHITYVEGRTMKSLTSRDGGETFETQSVIGPYVIPNGNLPHLQFFLFPFASTAADRSTGPHRGNVYTVWPGSVNAYPNGGNASPGTIWLSRSTDGGRSWSSPMALSTPYDAGDAMFPSLACDARTGEVVVAWLDRSGDPQNRLARIYATRSRDGGATFETARPFTSALDLTGSTFVGHYNGTAAEGGVWLTAFADAAGMLGVARLQFEELPRTPKRRSAQH